MSRHPATGLNAVSEIKAATRQLLQPQTCTICRHPVRFWISQLEFHLARDPRGAPLCGRTDDAQSDSAIIAPVVSAKKKTSDG
jgi:hypothetical protein